MLSVRFSSEPVRASSFARAEAEACYVPNSGNLFVVNFYVFFLHLGDLFFIFLFHVLSHVLLVVLLLLKRCDPGDGGSRRRGGVS